LLTAYAAGDPGDIDRPRGIEAQLFVLESQGSRSLDQIESILNRDKKDATYKPALFRALAELATTSYHAAIWLLLNARSVRQAVTVAGAGTGEQRRDGPGRFCGLLRTAHGGILQP